MLTFFFQAEKCNHVTQIFSHIHIIFVIWIIWTKLWFHLYVINWSFPKHCYLLFIHKFFVMCVRHKFWTQLIAIKSSNLRENGFNAECFGDCLSVHVMRDHGIYTEYALEAQCSHLMTGHWGTKVKNKQWVVTPNLHSWLLLVLPFLLFFSFLFFIQSNQPYMWLWTCPAYHSYTFNIILLIIPIFDNISTNKTLKYNIII
jgi:hypothetical protein